VDEHTRGQSGVVDLNAPDFMVDEKPPPTIVHIMAVRQELKVPFDHAGEAIRLPNTQPERATRRHRPSVVIPIQTLSREGLVGQRRNLVRELRHFPKGVLQPILSQPFRSGGNTESLFEQGCGVGLDSTTACSRLPSKLSLDFRCEVNGNCHKPFCKP